MSARALAGQEDERHAVWVVAVEAGQDVLAPLRWQLADVWHHVSGVLVIISDEQGKEREKKKKRKAGTGG